MSKITFEVSALKESSNALVDHFEVKFSKPVNGQWLYEVIEKGLKETEALKEARHDKRPG